MSVYGERKHAFLKQLLFCGLSGNHKRHVANEPRAAATFHMFYSPRSGLACHFMHPNRRGGGLCALVYAQAHKLQAHSRIILLTWTCGRCSEKLPIR